MSQRILRRRIADGENLMSKYSEDKERMDKIAYKIEHRELIKEWAVLYWLAVAVGHILEWIERNSK